MADGIHSEDRTSISRAGLRRDIAQVLLGLQPGERMPTVRALTERFGGSLGATQAAVASLQADGAFRTTSRGRNGTVLDERSVGALWAAAREEPFVVLLPLPSTRRIHALATAIKACLSRDGLEAYLGFTRGSQKRLDALRSRRCHAVVMSTLAARAVVGQSEEIALDLAPSSYVLEHRVLVRTDANGDPVSPRVVGIDTDSFDFRWLSRLEFPADAQVVHGSYMHLLDLLNQGGIDAMVWDTEETFGTVGSGIIARPLAPATLQDTGAANTSASMVIRREDAGVRAVLGAVLDTQTLTELQQDVLSGARAAEY